MMPNPATDRITLRSAMTQDDYARYFAIVRRREANWTSTILYAGTFFMAVPVALAFRSIGQYLAIVPADADLTGKCSLFAFLLGAITMVLAGAIARRLGVRNFVQGTLNAFEQKTVILDATGGESLKRSFRRLAPTGRVVNFGASSLVAGRKRSLLHMLGTLKETPIFTPFKLMNSNKGVYGLNMLQISDAALEEKFGIMKRAYDQVLQRFEDGTLKVVIGRTFPMAQGAEAHAHLQGRSNIGKVILTTDLTRLH